jgi:RNA polymerase sigma-54 factor
MNSLELRSDTRQSQTLSPRLQHAVRLLQLSSLDYAQEVQAALARNPFLEGEDRLGDVDGEGGDDAGDDADSAPNPEASLDGMLDSMAALDAQASSATGESDREIWQGEGARNGRGDGDDLAALDRMPAHESLAQHLHEQLIAEPMAARERLLAQMIIESLDDDGYLRTSLDELAGIAESCGLAPAPTQDEFESALRSVQALEPAGVGARDVAECLRLQLSGIEDASLRDRARKIIDEHLGMLASRDVPALARALGCTLAEAGQACERIRRFDPKPGWRHGGEPTHYVVPDVIVQKVRGQWAVKLNPAIVPRVRLNRLYADLLQRSRRETAAANAANAAHGTHAANATHAAHGTNTNGAAGTHGENAANGENDASAAPATPAEINAELNGQLQEARWTVRNVEQRFGTILGVAEAIVRRQKRFFDVGPMAMKPLCLQEIAEELGMHESTVSRVTNNKYLASPLGVFELKHFFSRAMTTASGGTCTGTAIRGLIQDMVAHEKADAPLSDVEIARRLGRQGLQLARRTVTKYRQMLKIEPVERRRNRALLVA